MIELALFSGTLIVTSSVIYALWTRVRLILLREELFQIRDDLWDHARKLGCLDDPAHRDARSHLNNCISVAAWISVAALQAPRRSTRQMPPVAENPDMQKYVENTFRASIATILRYALFHRISGWWYLAGVGTQGMFHALVRQWMYSDAVEELSRLERTTRPV